MADAERPISGFDAGAVDLNSYFLQANNGESSKVDIATIADFIAKTYVHQTLDTGADTLIGAINECAPIASRVPDPPTTAGTYRLTVTVTTTEGTDTDGNATTEYSYAYAWTEETA